VSVAVSFSSVVSLLHYSTSLPTDVNSWLVTFGFQLYNVIPGYHKPVTDAMEPSYELIHTQIKTQEWDSTKVIYPTNFSVCLPTSLKKHTWPLTLSSDFICSNLTFQFATSLRSPHQSTQMLARKSVASAPAPRAEGKGSS